MGIGAGHAEEELVADGLADDGGAGIDNFAYRGGRGGGWRCRRKPVRAAAPGAMARDVVHVLDRAGEAGEWSASGAGDRRAQIMRHEGRERMGSKRHYRAPRASSPNIRRASGWPVAWSAAMTARERHSVHLVVLMRQSISAAGTWKHAGFHLSPLAGRGRPRPARVYDAP